MSFQFSSAVVPTWNVTLLWMKVFIVCSKTYNEGYIQFNFSYVRVGLREAVLDAVGVREIVLDTDTVGVTVRVIVLDTDAVGVTERVTVAEIEGLLVTLRVTDGEGVPVRVTVAEIEGLLVSVLETEDEGVPVRVTVGVREGVRELEKKDGILIIGDGNALNVVGMAGNEGNSVSGNTVGILGNSVMKRDGIAGAEGTAVKSDGNSTIGIDGYAESVGNTGMLGISNDGTSGTLGNSVAVGNSGTLGNSSVEGMIGTLGTPSVGSSGI